MLVGALWGSIQELELAQPEFPWGGNSPRELHRALKDSSVSNFFFTKLSSPLSEEVVGLFYCPPPICLSLLFVVYAKQFHTAAILKQHSTYKMSHSLVSQMVRNALVGNRAHVKDQGQD